MKNGVPSSLNYVKLNDEKSATLHPYPSWDAAALPIETNIDRSTKNAAESNNILEKNNLTIVSGSAIAVDDCDRLWVLDSEKSNLFNYAIYWAPTTIAIFDLNTDILIRRIVIPSDLVKDRTFLANMVR